jgi:iduronate 2-sulfatase
MVTPRYHYIEWRYWDSVNMVSGDLAAVELYDRRTDLDENTNIAEFKANAQIVEQLSRQLRQGWRSAVPEGGPVPINRSDAHKSGNQQAAPQH